MSTNGIIADKNGEEDFLSEAIWNLFIAQVESTKSVIIGRKAYEGLVKWPQKYIDQLSGIIVIVITSKNDLKLLSNWKVATSPKDALKILNDSGISHSTVAGGATTNTAFLEQGLVTEIMYAIDPVVMGEGVPAFSTSSTEVELMLDSMQEISGIVVLKYKTNHYV